jgi:hypothetical protein
MMRLNQKIALVTALALVIFGAFAFLAVTPTPVMADDEQCNGDDPRCDYDQCEDNPFDYNCVPESERQDPEDAQILCTSICREGQNDGRINPGAVEASIYCKVDGVVILDIDIRGKAVNEFKVSYDQINEIGIPLENTLIAEQKGFRLYRLTTGELQLNAPGNWTNSGEYVFIWPGC